MAAFFVKRRERLGGQPDVVSPKSSSALDELHTKVEEAKVYLSAMASLDERKAYKHELLPGLMPLIEEYVASKSMKPNMDVVQVMIWLFDVELMEEALRLALYLIGQGNQHMPGRFERNIETFVGDSVYEWAVAQLNSGKTAEPYLSRTIQEMEVGHWRINFIVRGKLYAIAAKHADRLGRYEDVVRLCLKAEQANPQGAGVKTIKVRAMSQLDRAA